MQHLSENIRKYRLLKKLTQEDLAEHLGITAQSISKWERGESYPDISFLPALANIFETSIDLLMGMDEIRAAKARYNIHDQAVTCQRRGDYDSAEKIYRDALLIYPGEPEMLLGLGTTLALKGMASEAIDIMERGLAHSTGLKQNATIRATLCFLYQKTGQAERATRAASELPHMRESREVIQPLLAQPIDDAEIDRHIRLVILGE